MMPKFLKRWFNREPQDLDPELDANPAEAATPVVAQPLIDVDFAITSSEAEAAAERVDVKVVELKTMLDNGALNESGIRAQSLQEFLDSQPPVVHDADTNPWIPLSSKDLVTDEQRSVYRSTRMRRTRVQAELGEASAYALRVVAEVEKRRDAAAAEIDPAFAHDEEAARSTRIPPMTEAEQFEYDVQYSLFQLEGLHNDDARFQATALVLRHRWRG